MIVNAKYTFLLRSMGTVSLILGFPSFKLHGEDHTSSTPSQPHPPTSLPHRRVPASPGNAAIVLKWLSSCAGDEPGDGAQS